MENEIKVKINNGEKLNDLRIQILNLINNFDPNITGFEILGVLDVVKEDVHGEFKEEEGI